MQDPVQISCKMMNKMIEFWRKNSKYVEKRGQFSEKDLPMIQKNLS